MCLKLQRIFFHVLLMKFVLVSSTAQAILNDDDSNGGVTSGSDFELDMGKKFCVNMVITALWYK